MRERKGDRRCGDREEGREREKAGGEKRGGRTELKERREAARDGESNTHIYYSQTFILQTAYPSVSAITSQRFLATVQRAHRARHTVPDVRVDSFAVSFPVGDGAHEKEGPVYLSCSAHRLAT